LIDYKNLSIVEESSIPFGGNVSFDNPMDIYRLAVHMEQICLAKNGIGLAAPQIGIPLNLFIIMNDSGNEYYVNCSYEGVGDKVPFVEGCLSLINLDGSFKYYEVNRFGKVRVVGKKLVVQPGEIPLEFIDVDEVYEGVKSLVCQHEIDHMSGILISHIGKQVHMYTS